MSGASFNGAVGQFACLALLFSATATYAATDAYTPTPQQRDQLISLLGEPIVAANTRAPDPRIALQQALSVCEQSLNTARADNVCRDAQAKYEACRAAIDAWNARRAAWLATLDADHPGVGIEWSANVLNGGPKTLAEQFNDRVRTARTIQLPGCPGFLPNSTRTPLEALRHARAGDTYADDLFGQSAIDAADPTSSQRLAEEQRRKLDEVNQMQKDIDARSQAAADAVLSLGASALSASSTSGTSDYIPQVSAPTYGNNPSATTVTNWPQMTSPPSYKSVQTQPAGRPVTASGAPCADFKPISHTFPEGTSGKFERYDYQMTNGCGVNVVFTLGFNDGTTLEVGMSSTTASRTWFCTVGFLGNDDCVGGVKSWGYR